MYPVITISREFGSGGHEIGKRAAERLGIECYDSRLIRMASEKSCISEKYLKDVDEKRANPWLYTVPSDYADEMTGFGLPLNDMLFNVQSQIIRQLANQESCIIIGRCADSVLADYPGVITIFIHAEYGKDLRIMGGFDKMQLGAGKEAIRKYMESLVPLVERGGYIPFCDHRCPPNVKEEDYLYYLDLKKKMFGMQ